MKKILLIICIIFTTNILSAQDKETTATTTYFFIRHAEKANDSSKNPHLTDKGKERAVHWANILKGYKIDAVYSTDYFRTKETAEPTAKANKLETTLYDPRAFDFQNFINETKGKTVLVIGHSNTTPMYVNTFIGENKYGQIPENNYSNLYIITIKDNVVNDLQLCNL